LKFEIVPAHELSFSEQADVFNAAFTNYVGGSFHMQASSLAGFICAQGIDLCYSRFLRDDSGELVSFGYINRTGNVSRLAGMGTVPAARRSGAAGSVLSHLLEEARQRGDATMMLEVIEQNPGAHALYRSHGFKEVTRLFGWRNSGDQSPQNATHPGEISILQALSLPACVDYPTLPWQISRHAAAKVASAHAFGLHDSAVVIGDANASPIRLHGFLGCNGTSWEPFRHLIAGLLAKFPNREFYAPPIFPEQFGAEIFEPLKFRQEPINQFLMRKDL
jgi:ribosomal protein S18 acetylase RimI-like enzyme